jgi:hypothetical protein
MLSMHAFYKQLSAGELPTVYQRSLVLLTRINRAQIMAATSDSTWMIWEAAKTIPA